jgi:hypothetical protein
VNRQRGATRLVVFSFAIIDSIECRNPLPRPKIDPAVENPIRAQLRIELSFLGCLVGPLVRIGEAEKHCLAHGVSLG